MERSTPARHDHERIVGNRIGPLGGQRDQLTDAVAHVHAIRPPVVPALDELELPAGPRMERVRHSHPLQIAQILSITRSRPIDPTYASKRSTPRSG